jgi:regulator of protease activity HflC (stomatin/prohibitin superfamily)
MIDRLLDFLLSVFERIVPVIIVKEYDQAALFRFGKFLRILGPGMHFKIPVFDDPDVHTVVPTTLQLPAQSVTTKDGRQVVVKAVVKYSIADLEVFAVKAFDAKDALSDRTCGIVFRTIRSKTWDETHDTDMNPEITKEARREAKRWGIAVEEVTIVSYQQMRSLRIISEKE